MIIVGGTGTVSATATSGFAVSFSSTTPSICSVSGGSVTGITAGTCIIAANQAGDASYSAAMQMTQSISIHLSQTDCVFSWAEQTYPLYFDPPGASSVTYAPYYYRHYAGSATYLATSSADNHVWVLGPVFGNAMVDVGPVASFLTTAGCTL
jgi:hypothetical protein